MFTKMSNSRSSGYPLVNVTKNGVDGVISLDCLVDSWVWQSLILNFLIIFLVMIIISPFDQCPPLEVDHRLDLHPLLLEPYPHLELVEMLVQKMIVVGVSRQRGSQSRRVSVLRAPAQMGRARGRARRGERRGGRSRA
jgi:hypothetical protein